MRQVNLRALIILAVSLLVVGTGIYWLHGYQVRRNAGILLEAAEKAKESGDVAEAVRNLEWYVGLVPSDADAWTELGEIFADGGNNSRAYSTFETVLRLDPKRDDVRRRLIRVALSLRRFSDAKEHLQDHLLGDDPDDPELLFWLGECQEASQEFEAAETSYRKSLHADPTRLGAYIRLASVLRQALETPEEADEIIRQMVEANPDSCEAHLYRAHYIQTTVTGEEYRDHGRDEVAKEAAAALKIAPDDVDALLLAARCELEQKDFRAARRYASRAERLSPSRASVFSTLADIELKAGDRKEAMNCLQRGLKVQPDSPELLWNLAMLHADEDQVDKAAEILTKLKAVGYRPALIGYLEGRIELLRGNWLTASRLFATSRTELTTWPDLAKQADYCLGKCYQELGQPDLEIQAYRRAAAIDLDWAPPRIGIAASLVSAGRFEEALRECQKIATMENIPKDASVQLARLALLCDLARAPDDRDDKEIEQYLARAAEATPDSAAVAIYRAELLFAQNLVSETEALLLAAREKQPDAVELHLALASLADRCEKWEEAEQYLDEADARFGHRADLQLARGQHYARQLGSAAMPKVRQILQASADFDAAEKIKFQRGMASVCLQLGDYDQARRLLQQVSEARPNDLLTRTILFDLALQANDTSGLKEQLQQIREITGESPLWRYARAVYLTLTAKQPGGDNLEQALDCIAEARIARPDWSRLPLLAGRIYERLGNQGRAIEEYLRAIELGETNPVVIRQVADLLCRQQRYLEADRVIRRLGEQVTPFSNQINRVASAVAMQMADFDRAQQMARQAAEHSNDFRDHTWLGQVLGTQGRQAKSQGRDAEADQYFQEAEEELRKAVSLAHASPTSWLALVQFLEWSGQHEKARQAIEEAEKAVNQDDAPLAMAQCYDAAGDAEEAEKRYEQALAAAPDNPTVVRQAAEFFLRSDKSDEAEKLLKRIVEGKLQAPRGDVLWARRSLAMMGFAHGGYENLQNSLRLVEENLAADPYSVQDQRTKVFLLASYPGREERRQAIQTLEDYLKTQPSAAPAERVLLARLCLADDDWPGFRRHMQRVLTNRSDNPIYLALYIRALLSRNEVSEAGLWLKQLEKVAPHEFETIALKTKLAAANKDPETAIATVKDYVANRAPDGRPAGYHKAVAAALLNEIGLTLNQSDDLQQSRSAKKFFEAAEALYREVVEGDPDRGLVLVPFLARQNRLNEAIDVAERYWKSASPVAIQLGLSPILMNPAASTSQVDRTETILQAAIAAHHRPANLLLLQADLYGLRGKLQEAEGIYREVLRANPRNVGAMNNLALVLVYQNKDLAEAEKLINAAVAAVGPRSNLLDTRAAVYLAMNKPQDAVNDLLQSLAERPSAVLYFHLAQAQQQLGRSGAARNSLKEAYKLGLNDEMLHPLERPHFRALRAALR